MSMPAIVILSSSPRTFARSPTPADSSSPLPSPGAIIRGTPIGSRRFKSTTAVRDGFSGGFGSARSLLSPKIGAENIPLQSPSREKFKRTSSDLVRGSRAQATGTLPNMDIVRTSGGRLKQQEPPLADLRRSPEVFAQAEVCILQENKDPMSLPDNGEGLSHRQSCSPSPLEKAIPRRLDWTPTKTPAPPSASPESERESATLSKQMLNSFAYTGSFVGDAVGKVTTKADASGGPMKRRRIDLLMTTESHTNPLLPLSETDSLKGREKNERKGKTKSVNKRARTITELATLHYGEEFREHSKVVPMLEYLTSTQLGAGDDPIISDKEAGKRPKPKATKRKPRVTKQVPAKSRLDSPTSAMKVVSRQEMLFGSASQLARDESPEFLRETLEALKRSECFSSDPVSPQQTQPFSIESTSPRAHRGTNRFVKRKNLWNAAGRDEDNALLHIDTVDLSDSPAVRLALAGKDALLQPGDSNDKAHARRSSLLETETPLINKATSLLDIDDIVTPGLTLAAKSPTKVQSRAYHSSGPLEEPRKQGSPERTVAQARPPDRAANKVPQSIPARPSYAGFTTNELQKQISAYGFKRIKKRETMIELLERCWDNKHGVSTTNDDSQSAVNTMTHGDFLAEVHDVSARPAPKVKKPRAKRASDSAPSVPDKEPKKRKKPATKPKDPPAKDAATPRKRASKAVSTDAVLDVDDIYDLDAQKPDHARTEASSEKKNQTKPARNKGKGAASSKMPQSPPPALPLGFSSSSALQAVHDQSVDVTKGSSNSPRHVSSIDGCHTAGSTSAPGESLPLADLQHQIHAAIHHASGLQSGHKDSRNHQKNPTWREKILMYDPIVLEELTVWLNTEGFKAVGEDREVSLIEVKSWCEQNGVCCYGIAGGWRRRDRHVDAE